MKKRSAGQAGFTLIELIVGLSITGFVVSGIGTTIFHSVRTSKNVVRDGQAINELRKGLSWFSTDVKMAKTTNLTDGAPASSSVTFDWTDEYGGDGTAHTLTYTLSSGRLIRTLDGFAYPVASRVNSVSFTRSGRVITAQAQVDAGFGRTRTLSVDSLMRATQ